MEDQSDAAQVLAKGLSEQSYAVDIAADGETALYQASINDYDLVLLDVMLPLPLLLLVVFSSVRCRADAEEQKVTQGLLITL